MPFHTLSRSRYSPALLARVAQGWRRIAEDERRGVASAAHIAADLAALGAPPAILAAAARVIADEVHHLDVCACVLDELEPAARGNAVRSATSRRLDLVPRAPVGESVLARTLVAEYALGKPPSATAFAAARALSREPLFAWAYAELLHDEARHATFGAKTAAWVIRRWSPRQRRALWAESLTSSTVAAARPRDEEAESLGLLPASSDGALPRWILPHLEPLGMQATPSPGSGSGSGSGPANETRFIH
ncbi:MAG TPA: hypothetical protein VLC06_26315 [Polyangia bacterium]|nr:hypothetical protein [Polyangia bacterium]